MVACVAGAFQRGSKILQFNGSQRITCDQAFFFSGKGKTKVSQTKREEGPPDRRLLNGQMRLINYQLKYLPQLSTASRDFGTTIKFLRLDGRRIRINCMWYRSRFEQSRFSSHLSSLFPGGRENSWEFLVDIHINLSSSPEIHH